MNIPENVCLLPMLQMYESVLLRNTHFKGFKVIITFLVYLANDLACLLVITS